jgi:hypothetical protein
MKRSPSASGGAGRPARDAVAVVVEDLRARAARTGVAHRPEIVGAGDAHDPGVGQPGDLLPQIERLVVVDVDRHHQAVDRDGELLGDQVPGELDRAVLEVVAEREVAEHLEEGVVARRVADIVEVVVLAAGAHAFLRRGGAHERQLLDAGEHVLELHHAGIGEHQGRVVARHQRRGRHHLVPVLREVAQEGRPDIVDAAHAKPLLRDLCNPEAADGGAARGRFANLSNGSSEGAKACPGSRPAAPTRMTGGGLSAISRRQPRREDAAETACHPDFP